MKVAIVIMRMYFSLILKTDREEEEVDRKDVGANDEADGDGVRNGTLAAGSMVMRPYDLLLDTISSFS